MRVVQTKWTTGIESFSRLTKEGMTHDHGRADLGMTMADLDYAMTFDTTKLFNTDFRGFPI
jgi:hypothetical protein